MFGLFSFVPFDLYFHFKFGFKFRVLPAYIIVGFHHRGFGLPSEEITRTPQKSTKGGLIYLNIIYTIIYQMAINNRKMNKLLLCKMTQTSPVELTCVITLKGPL